MRKLALVLLLCGCAKSKDAAPAPSSSAAPVETPSAPAASPAGKEAAGDKEITLDQATDGLGKGGKLVAEIVTDLGSIHCELLPDAAPKTVASFVGLARGLRPFEDPATGKWVTRPFFDGLAFHRVIPGFMIQGGDPFSANYQDPRIGSGGPGYTLPDEIAPWP